MWKMTSSVPLRGVCPGCSLCLGHLPGSEITSAKTQEQSNQSTPLCPPLSLTSFPVPHHPLPGILSITYLPIHYWLEPQHFQKAGVCLSVCHCGDLGPQTASTLYPAGAWETGGERRKKFHSSETQPPSPRHSFLLATGVPWTRTLCSSLHLSEQTQDPALGELTS